TAEDELDPAVFLGDLSLREAVALANANPGPDTITFAAALSGVPIRLTLGEILITDDVTIQGLGADRTVLDAQGQSRHFRMLTRDATLDSLTLTGGHTTEDFFGGGAVRFQGIGTLTVQNCVLIGNSTQGTNAVGGAIYALSTLGEVRVINSTLTGNSTQ